MADKKISQLGKLQTIDGTEQIPVAKDGENYSITPQQIFNGEEYYTKEQTDGAFVSQETYAKDKQSTEARFDEVKQAQAEDLAKITELQGKLNGIDDLQETLDEKADKDDVYTKAEADGKFLTEHQDISGKADKTDLDEYDKSTVVDGKVSAAKSEVEKWVEGKNYLTEHQDISHLATKTDVTQGLQAKLDKTEFTERMQSVTEQIATKADQTAVDDILKLIPTQATESNKLADKDFVNSSIATNTAEFKGTFESLEELKKQDADANDYGFVVSTDLDGNTVYNRYKWTSSGWVFEYKLNNNPLTAAQFAALNSGATAELIEKLAALPTASVLASTYATKTELGVIETLAESVNTGLGESLVRITALETGLEADKTNLKNFKQNVEENYVKDDDYNKDKEVLAGQIMDKADKTELAKYLPLSGTAAAAQKLICTPTTTTDISKVPTTSQMCVANISASGTFGLASAMTAGTELQVFINNTGSDDITITIPDTFKSNGLTEITIQAGNYGEINVISDGTNLYLRAVDGNGGGNSMELKDGDYFLYSRYSFEVDGDSTDFSGIIFNIFGNDLSIYRSDIIYYEKKEFPYTLNVSVARNGMVSIVGLDEYRSEQDVLSIADNICKYVTKTVNEICGTNYKSAGAKYPLYSGSFEQITKIEYD